MVSYPYSIDASLWEPFLLLGGHNNIPRLSGHHLRFLPHYLVSLFPRLSLSVFLDWKPYWVLQSCGGLCGPSVISVGHHWPFDSSIPRPPFSSPLSLPLFPSLFLPDLYLFLMLIRTGLVWYGWYRFIPLVGQNSLQYQLRRSWLFVRDLLKTLLIDLSKDCWTDTGTHAGQRLIQYGTISYYTVPVHDHLGEIKKKPPPSQTKIDELDPK